MALTADGLTIRRLPEVLDDIITSMQTEVDENINASEDTSLGQILTILSASIAEQEANGQAINDNFNPLKAEGKNLDDLAAIIGIVRSAATNTSGVMNLTGDDGSVIAVNTLSTLPPTLTLLALVLRHWRYYRVLKLTSLLTELKLGLLLLILVGRLSRSPLTMWLCQIVMTLTGQLM